MLNGFKLELDWRFGGRFWSPLRSSMFLLFPGPTIALVYPTAIAIAHRSCSSLTSLTQMVVVVVKVDLEWQFKSGHLPPLFSAMNYGLVTRQWWCASYRPHILSFSLSLSMDSQ